MVDFHPALAQLLLFLWTTLFGITEVSVRLPFVLFGVATLIVVFLVSKEWFNKNTALLTIAAMAGLQFFIMYSQLARPYSPGLFFTWVAALYWTKIIKGRKSYLYAILGGVAVALAMYTHYFSFMQVMLMSVIGLFWINRQTIKYYLTAGMVALVLWLPHLGITIHHVSKGGVGTWLGPPESDFLWTYVLYIFNDSVGIFILFLLIGLIGLAFNAPGVRINKWQLVCILLFLLPFFIGFYYSKFVNPVLQYSTLLFAAPALLMFMFSFFGSRTPKWLTTVLVILILSSTTFSTVAITRYYSTDNFGVFKELAVQIKTWDEKFGAENILKLSHVNSPAYLDHYFERLNHPTTFAMFDVDTDSSRAELRKLLAESETPFVTFAWSTHYVAPETYEIIRSEYPQMVELEDHFNSGIYLFNRAGSDEREILFSAEAVSPPIDTTFIGIDEAKLIEDSLGRSLILYPEDEYSWSFSYTAEGLNIQGGELLVIKTVLQSSPDTDITLVLEHTSEVLENKWYGNDLYPGYSNMDSDLHEVILAYHIPEGISPKDALKSYLWKRSEEPVRVRSFEVILYPQNSRP